ncbi:MAG: hypothetical protein LUF78_08370 [Clostridiales bacterium]|nr:hypothetical protein [Clostridiales bacterium]
MKEIGGYLELENFSGVEYHQGLYAMNLCRTALVFFLKKVHCQKLYVPRLLCDSVTEMCRREEIPLEFYQLDNHFLPTGRISLETDEWLLAVSYFGQLTDKKILFLKEKYGRIIADLTHSFFQRPLPGIPTVYSCRKYFGLPDGAYLSSPFPLELPEISHDSPAHMSHILGRFEDGASPHYGEMRTVASGFYQAKPAGMSRLTHNLLRGIDYPSVKGRREENYQTLEEYLGEYNPVSPKYNPDNELSGHRIFRTRETFRLPFFQPPEGPLAYPFYFPQGVHLRKALADVNIYVPTYWQNVILENPVDTLEHQCASNILALPCDQRYTASDMTYMAELTKQVINRISN